MKELSLEFMTEFDVTLTVERVSIDDDNRKFIGTYVDASDLATLSKRPVSVYLDGVINKMNDRFARIEDDFNQRLSEQFYSKQLSCFGEPAYKMWVSDAGYVYLCGKLTIVYGIKMSFSNDVANTIRAVADDVMTDNIYKTTDLTYRVTFWGGV